MRAQAMEGIWGQGEHVQVIHPGGDCIAGRAMVRKGVGAAAAAHGACVRPSAWWHGAPGLAAS